MRFPRSERLTFGKDTLVEVICQLRFPKILSIGAEAPARFQEAIRVNYPVYRRQGPLGAPPELAAVLDQLPFTPPIEAVTHWFESADGEGAISLAPDFVAITSRRYPGWERFRSEVARAMNALEEAYSPAFFERLGLRYHDVINREALGLSDRPWAELLKPEMVTFVGADLGIAPGQDAIYTEAVLKLDEPTGAAVRIQHGFRADGEHTYDLDADYFIEGQIHKENAFVLLEQFHDEEGYFFRWAIQPALHVALDPQPVDPQSVL